MKRRYAVAISAMSMALPMADRAASAEPSSEQLETISALLDANDVRGLRSYVAANPELLEGTSPLARLLAEYMVESSDVVAFLGVAPSRTFDDDDDDDPFREELLDRLSEAPDHVEAETASLGSDEPAASAPDVSIY